MDEQRLIPVTGTAKEKLPANRVEISVSATGEADAYVKAVNASDSLADGAVDALKAAGIENVRAAGVNVTVVRDGKKVTGYRATRKLTVEFEYEKTLLAKVLDALGKSKCEWRVAFALKNDEMRQTLVARAVTEAKQSAEVIAKAAGVKLGSLVKAEYVSTGGGHAVMRMAAVYGADNAADPEEITLSETVTCSWEIK